MCSSDLFPDMSREGQFLVGMMLGGALCAGAIELAALPWLAGLWAGVLGLGAVVALVEVGTSVPEIVRGPYTATVAVAFEQAWGGLFVWAHAYWYDYLQRHPAAGVLNGYGIPEPPEAVHWDTVLARSVGVPEAYDYGPERISWISVMLTNWIGDQGFLEELYCEIRRFNLVGDTTFCRGRITGKEELPDGRGRVKLIVEAVDQRDQITAKGWATVLLPRRGG